MYCCYSAITGVPFLQGEKKLSRGYLKYLSSFFLLLRLVPFSRQGDAWHSFPDLRGLRRTGSRLPSLDPASDVPTPLDPRMKVFYTSFFKKYFYFLSFCHIIFLWEGIWRDCTRNETKQCLKVPFIKFLFGILKRKIKLFGISLSVSLNSEVGSCGVSLEISVI